MTRLSLNPQEDEKAAEETPAAAAADASDVSVDAMADLEAAEAASTASSADSTEPVEANAPELEADADKATDASVGESASDGISDEL